METLKNKIALVTGGNSGIGYAAAKELISRGATVIITGRRKAAVEEAAVKLGAVPFIADQANLNDTTALYEFILERFGKLDILFINAGITGAGGPIAGMSETQFDEVMNINFKGAYFALSKLNSLLPEGASVVILSSIVAQTHMPNSSVYQASKAALNSVAKTAAAELAPRKIRVNLISPGPTQTEILTKIGLDEQTLNALNERLVQQIPLKRMGTAEDVAKLVVYLCEDAAQFITGAEIVVDGGMTL